MRGKDIEIGKEYLIGYGMGGKVLATGVPTGSYGGARRNNGVRVSLIHPKHRMGEEVIYISRDIKEPWENYASRKRAEKLKKQLREEAIASRQSRVNEYSSKISNAGITVEGAEFSRWEDMESENFTVTLRLDSVEVEKLIAALTQPQSKKRIADYRPQEKEQSGSALAQMFGGSR